MKTADHFWTDPSADELVQRHRIHGGHCRQDSPTKRPALCVSTRRTTGGAADYCAKEALRRIPVVRTRCSAAVAEFQDAHHFSRRPNIMSRLKTLLIIYRYVQKS